ncbi:MAG: hypothetical protein SVU32_05375 [Candidatus Nanohaloarchaea archaeon]|nr:hypothetical protein [Candidatus Nanohaloarchaea archaeon]
MLAGIGVGAAILNSMSSSATPDSRLAQQVRNADYPICGSFEQGQRINAREFKTIVYARYLTKCEQHSNTVKIGFTLTSEKLQTFAKTFKIVDSDGDPLILYGSCDPPAGFTGIVIEADKQKVIYQETTTLTIEQAGKAVTVCTA